MERFHIIIDSRPTEYQKAIMEGERLYREVLDLVGATPNDLPKE